MKTKILLALVVGGFFIGCGQPEITDPCELDYQKCSATCKLNNVSEAQWKQLACESKCKTLFGACKTKEGTIKGYNYLKDKINN